MSIQLRLNLAIALLSALGLICMIAFILLDAKPRMEVVNASTMLLTVAALPVAPNAATLIAVTPVKLYTQAGAAVVLDPLVTLVDVDSDAPTRATVAIMRKISSRISRWNLRRSSSIGFV